MLHDSEARSSKIRPFLRRSDDGPPIAGARFTVVCVLGCRSQSQALARRAGAASQAFRERAADLVVACGGRAWRGEVEADALAARLVAGGVPEDRILRERSSLDTLENAQFARGILGRYGLGEARVTVVTCAWHLPRAVRLFAGTGLEVDGVGVEPPGAGATRRAYWHVRERLSTWKDVRRGGIVR